MQSFPQCMLASGAGGINFHLPTEDYTDRHKEERRTRLQLLTLSIEELDGFSCNNSFNWNPCYINITISPRLQTMC